MKDFKAFYLKQAEFGGRKFLAAYARFVLNELLPKETKDNKVYNKPLFISRETKSWFRLGGAFI